MMDYGHIGGERGAAFARRVAGLDPDRVLLVGVDVAKPTWFVLGCTLGGEIVLEGRRLVANQAGFGRLLAVVEQTRARLDAQVAVVGVEAAGHQHLTLVGHLRDVDGVEVCTLNPAAVAEERKKQLHRRRKSDAADAAACCQLLRNGQGTIPPPAGTPAVALRALWSGRKDLVEARARLRQQMHALVDCLWPGLTADDAEVGVVPLLASGLLDTKSGRVIVALLAEGWDAGRFAGCDIEGLRALFAERGCRLNRPLAGRIRRFAAASLPPHPTATAGKQALLQQLWATFLGLSLRIDDLEQAMAGLLADTQGAKLVQIPGIATVTAAGVVAFIGEVDRWHSWSAVWRAAGLDPARAQSGDSDPHLGISREGSAWGRHALLDATISVIRQPGRFGELYQRRLGAGKPDKVAVIACGNNLGRTMYAMMASGDDYDPDFETTRRTRQGAPMAA